MKVYLIGIGGIGMSALAEYFLQSGNQVSGYDRTPSKLTDRMQKDGIEIHFEDRPDIFRDFVKGCRPEEVLIIYTPAVPQDLGEMIAVRESGFKVVKRSRALGEIASRKSCYAVAGTHGKTSTSTMLAHIFRHCGTGCSAFLGGISKNYGTNLLVSGSDYLVAEADEFDRSFLQLFPDTAVITSTDADHLDIYGDVKTIKEAFAEFASQISRNLILKKGVDIDESHIKARIYRYGILEKCDFYADNIQEIDNGEFTYDLHLLDTDIKGCTLGIPGYVNIENSVAAAASAYLAGIDPESIRKALKDFIGVERRFDVRHKGKTVYIDDYAHHPKELEATIKSIRQIYPGKHITGIFQPHLYTRTRDFADDFAQVLNLLDHIILLPIYPARELPIEGVTSEMLAKKILVAGGKTAEIVQKPDLIEHLRTMDNDIIVTFGAGDIDRLVPGIANMLKEKENA